MGRVSYWLSERVARFRSSGYDLGSSKLKQMIRRLKPMLSVLLTLLLCGASSQSAICELSCRLASEPECHIAAPSHESATTGITSHNRCSAPMQAAPEMGKRQMICSRHGFLCGHSSLPAVVEQFAVQHQSTGLELVLSVRLPAERSVFRTAVLLRKRPPPVLGAPNPLIASLRI